MVLSRCWDAAAAASTALLCGAIGLGFKQAAVGGAYRGGHRDRRWLGQLQRSRGLFTARPSFGHISMPHCCLALRAATQHLPLLHALQPRNLLCRACLLVARRQRCRCRTSCRCLLLLHALHSSGQVAAAGKRAAGVQGAARACRHSGASTALPIAHCCWPHQVPSI